VGEYHIAVNVTDENGSCVTEVYNVTVIATNDPPQLWPMGVLRARAGERFRFLVQATDPDGDRLLFTSSSSLFRINATTGEISFVPGEGAVGIHEFSVEVIDAGGLNANASGVLVISSRPAGTPVARLAGYGLAGLGGLNPWLILAISMALAGALSAEYIRLGWLEKREEQAARNAKAGERSAVPPRKKTVKKLKRGEACGLCGREISIKESSDNHACSCGAQYHSKCFRKAGRCPECGRGKGRPR